nr:FxsA family protein [uncultured Cohaesibacter sp.]
MQKSLFPFIPFLLLIIPVLEIGVFILVGEQIGVINTLLGIVLTAVIGTILLRRQGFALLSQAQGQMNAGRVPGKELAHGVMLLAAGLLLLTPGFVTDTFGFLLLVPTIRDGIFAFFKSRITLVNVGATQSGFSSGNAGGTYYRSYSYSSTDTGPKGKGSKDSSVIDLDEGDFNEVTDHEAIEAKPSDGKKDSKDGQSPWEKS